MTAAGREGGGQREAERDERVTLPTTERLGRGGPGPVLVALLVASAFLVGVVRPWDWLAAGSASPETGPAAPPAGSSSQPGRAQESPSSAAETSGSGAATGTDGAEASAGALTPAQAPVVEPTCAYPRSWRLAAIQDWGGRTARVWSATDAVPAAGPGDPVIPFTTIASTTVTAIGWCAPVSGPDRPPLAAAGTLFRLDPDGPREISFDRLEPSAPDALGELWMPVPQSVGRRPPWRPGLYVIRLAAPGGTFERYLGIEVVRAVRAAPSAIPASP